MGLHLNQEGKTGKAWLRDCPDQSEGVKKLQTHTRAETLGPDGEAPAAWKLLAFSCTSGRGVRVADLGRGVSRGAVSGGSYYGGESFPHSIPTLNRGRPCYSLGSEALMSFHGSAHVLNTHSYIQGYICSPQNLLINQTTQCPLNNRINDSKKTDQGK